MDQSYYSSNSCDNNCDRQEIRPPFQDEQNIEKKKDSNNSTDDFADENSPFSILFTSFLSHPSVQVVQLMATTMVVSYTAYFTVEIIPNFWAIQTCDIRYISFFHIE